MKSINPFSMRGITVFPNPVGVNAPAMVRHMVASSAIILSYKIHASYSLLALKELDDLIWFTRRFMEDIFKDLGIILGSFIRSLIDIISFLSFSEGF